MSLLAEINDAICIFDNPDRMIEMSDGTEISYRELMHLEALECLRALNRMGYALVKKDTLSVEQKIEVKEKSGAFPESELVHKYLSILDKGNLLKSFE